MTRLNGMTLTEFNGLVEDMRRIYPFKDERAKIVDTHDLMTGSNNLLELYVHDEENDVDILLSKSLKKDVWQYNAEVELEGNNG